MRKRSRSSKNDSQAKSYRGWCQRDPTEEVSVHQFPGAGSKAKKTRERILGNKREYSTFTCNRHLKINISKAQHFPQKSAPTLAFPVTGW